MPAATTLPCVQCASPTSRYKCSKCFQSTCSLACSKAHSPKNCPGAATYSSFSGATATLAAPAAPAAMGSSGSGSSVPSPHAPAANTNQRPAHDYVAMNKYDEGQLMRDYQFLSDIGRKVGSWGRTLSQQKWAANAQIANGPSQQSNNPGNQRPERLTAAQQKREALRKQINFRRLQIMLLPDGMEQRRANHTVWHNKERKMVYTVELRFPFAETDQVLPPLTMEGVVSRSPPTKPSNARSRKERRKGERAFAHQQESDTPVADMVLAELTRNTVGKAGKKKEAAKRDGKPDIKGKGKAADPERWKVSDAVWRAYGLVGDFSSSVSPTSVPAKSDGDDNADIGTSETDSDASSYDALPPWAVVVMPVYPLRLRHESSTKHVEWWARQMEKARQHAAAGGPGAAPNGPSGPHGIDRGAQPQHVGPHNSQMNAVQGGHHDRRTSGAMNAAHMSSPMRPPGGPVMQQPPNSYMNMAQWNARGDMVHQPPPGGYTGPPPGFDAYGPAQNMGVPQGPAQQQLPQQGQMRQSNNPLLPLHVLDKLSAQMGAGRAQPQQAEVTKAGPGATSQVTDVGATATPIAPKAMASAPQSAPLPSASVYVALSALPDLCPGSERYSASSPPGIEAILGRLPQGYGVVEYAILEIWPRAMLAEAVQKGEVDLRPLEELSEKERLERGQRGAEQAGQREKAKRAHDDDEEEKGESSGSESDVGPSDATAEARASGTSDAKRVRIDTPNQAQTQTPAPVVASQSEAPLGLGLDYDSDSDADEGAVEEQMDGQMQLDEAEIAAARAELLPPPGQDQEKSKGPVGIAGYGYGSDSDEEDEQGDGEGEGGGAETGLAAIARKLGFAPPRPAPTSMTTPGKGQGETRGPSEVGTAKGEGAAGEMGQAEIKAVKAEKSLLEDEREDAVDWGSDGEM